MENLLTHWPLNSSTRYLPPYLVLGVSDLRWVCVCVQLMYGGSRTQLSSPSFLNPLLQSALDSSLHGDSPYTQLLSFAVGRPHTAIQPYGMALSPSHSPSSTLSLPSIAVDALDYLSLSYKVLPPADR